MAPVVAVDRAQWRMVSEALAAAFYDDPVFGWLLPNDARRAGALRRFFAIEARHVVLAHGCSVALHSDGAASGVALVLPPGRWRTPVHVPLLHGSAYLSAFRQRSPRALAVLLSLEHHHLRRPHYYLPYIGVVPAAQGRGVGTALLAPMLERCDREGRPAYLEASNPRCAGLYRRLGFDTVEELRPYGSPPIELMVREPVAQPS